MLIYYAEIDVATGFELLSATSKHDRLLRGVVVSRPNGWKLFSSLHAEGRPIQCWCCGIKADRWVSTRGRHDKQGGTGLNLFALDNVGHPVLLTRDHIIPSSLGGMDVVDNLRIACEPCNGKRGNSMTATELQFMKDHPEVIDKERLEKSIATAKRHLWKFDRDAVRQLQDLDLDHMVRLAAHPYTGIALVLKMEQQLLFKQLHEARRREHARISEPFQTVGINVEDW